MGLAIRILMVLAIILVLVLDAFFLILASSDTPHCVTLLTSQGTSTVESANDTCNDFVAMREHRPLILGISAAIIVASFSVIVGAVGLAFAIAFGLGCKDIAGDFVAGLFKGK